MKIAFHTPNLNIRGTCVALYDYAHYNETILNNTSIIITRKDQSHEPIAVQRFRKRFPISMYDTLEELEQLTSKVDVLYCIKYGTNDGVVLVNTPTLVHCVFDMSEPHGDMYVAISKTLAYKFKRVAYIPHIVRTPMVKSPTDLRSTLNIPNDALVFGRHGGLDTFNLAFVKEAISEIVRIYPKVYFVFMNACAWDDHSRIIILPPTTDCTYKEQYISMCDAMIVPETMGHTFGLSCAEFSVLQKPIICYNGPDVWNRAHIDILGTRGIYFTTKEEFCDIITTFNPRDYVDRDMNAYRDYNPERVMSIFKNKINEII